MIIYEVYMNPKNAVIYDMKVAKKKFKNHSLVTL